MTMKYFLFLACLIIASLESIESKYSVDISFLTADLKYSNEHGVKICEVQHGILSTFTGDTFLNKKGKIPSNFGEILSEFPVTKWTLPSGIASVHIKSMINMLDDWKCKNKFDFIVKDSEFLEKAIYEPKDLTDISTYHGLLFVATYFFNEPEFEEKYPGIMVMDKAIAPYRADKYKMSLLFNSNETLSSIKAEWKLYPKKYTESLAEKVIKDLKGDLYVIKPRGGFLGNGVIIVKEEDLDSTLKYILSKSDHLHKNRDKSYSFWYKDRSDSFIVEKFYPSDCVNVPALKNEVYHPTMRAAFLLIYNKGEIDYRLLGEPYWIIPGVPVGNDGSPNEIYKSKCGIPFFAEASEEVRRDVEDQLSHAIPLLYKEMLENR